MLDVHRRYVEAGCDVVSTNTWAILAAAELESDGSVGGFALTHWLDVARLGVALARQAVEEGHGAGVGAVAFSVLGDVHTEERLASLRLLLRVLEEHPPDVLLLETMSLIREDFTFRAVEVALESGLPVWLSFRRCRHGVCGVYGQHWGGPEGDLFGRAAKRFEELGVSALLVNCLPPDHVAGMLPWLRDFTDLPLGVYPNLGYFSDWGWRFDERIGPREYAELAAGWREEGAQIIGGCCGTSPAHVAAVRERLAGTKPGRPPSVALPSVDVISAPSAHGPWLDENGRSLYPLRFPELTFDPDVFVPTLGSLLRLEARLSHRARRGQELPRRRLWQRSSFGAARVERSGARRRDRHRPGGRGEHARERVPQRRLGARGREGGRPLHVRAGAPLRRRPGEPVPDAGRSLRGAERPSPARLLGPEPARPPPPAPAVPARGRRIALVMQLSILSRLRTAELLDEHGLVARVVDFGFFPFCAARSSRTCRRSSASSERLDAYHLALGDERVMVAYLLEISRR